MNQNVDKVNMSLDDIIKLNRKQKQGNNRAAGRNNFNRPKNSPNTTNNNNNNNNNRSFQKSPGKNNIVKQQNKPFGMLNKSKQIQKKRNNPNFGVRSNITMATNNNGIRRNRNGANSSRIQNLTRIKRRRNNRNLQLNRAAIRTNNANRPRGPNIQNHQPQQQQVQQQRSKSVSFARKAAIVPIQRRVKPQQPQQRQRVNGTAPLRNKIAMQTARKNIQKAKRILATRKGPIQQIMTQRYARNLLSASKALAKPRRPIVMKKSATMPLKSRKASILRVNVSNKIKQQKQRIQAKQLTMSNRPKISNKASIKQNSSGKSRMVFY